jgi:hypothetical protein
MLSRGKIYSPLPDFLVRLAGKSWKELVALEDSQKAMQKVVI